MVTRRRGMTRLGCLVTLLLVVAVGYFAMNVGEAYWRYVQFRDAMKQDARFSAHRTDEEIRLHLRAVADSLGLPESARNIRIRRSQNHISISSEYYEHIELPLVVREVLMSPRVEWTL